MGSKVASVARAWRLHLGVYSVLFVGQRDERRLSEVAGVLFNSGALSLLSATRLGAMALFRDLSRSDRNGATYFIHLQTAPQLSGSGWNGATYFIGRPQTQTIQKDSPGGKAKKKITLQSPVVDEAQSVTSLRSLGGDVTSPPNIFRDLSSCARKVSGHVSTRTRERHLPRVQIASLCA